MKRGKGTEISMDAKHRGIPDMKSEWPVVTLGDVAVIQSGAGFPDRYQGQVGQEIPFYKVSDMNIVGNEREMIYENNSITEAARRELRAFLFPRGSIIFPKIGGAIATNKKRLTTRDCCVDNNVMGVVPKPRSVSTAFLFYFFLAHDLTEFANEAHLPSIQKKTVESWPFACPSFLEQQRIVEVLDEAFAGLVTAQYNAEKNIENARALFDGHLHDIFDRRNEGWVEATVGECIRFIDYRGKTPEKTTSGLRLITAKNVKMGVLLREPEEFVAPETYDSWMTRGIPVKGDVLFTTEAPLANVAQLDTDEKVVFAQRIIIMQPNASRLEKAFLKYLLLSQSVQERIHAKGTGATVKGIKASLLKTIEISFPRKLEHQQRCVSQLDALAVETNQLARIYEDKLEALLAVRKALLHQAFTGELTREWRETQPVSVPIPFSNPTLVDLQAGLMAIAYRHHEKHGKQEDFGHVKAEKNTHLVEAWVGVDLDRSPVQDAAGPIDFPRLRAAEDHAKAEGYFQFRKEKGGSYRITKLEKFDELVARTESALGEKRAAVERLLDLTVGMERQEIEIVATVFAAWNNLMLEGAEVTEEAIVRGAREEWHPEKLKIDRERFFEVIPWMKENGLIPQGTGKRVVPKPSKE